MKKSTAAISLVLIGSALFVGGCSSDDEDDDREQGRAGGHAVIGRPGAYIGRVGGGAGRATAGAGVSARGGFGRTGGFGVGA